MPCAMRATYRPRPITRRVLKLNDDNRRRSSKVSNDALRWKPREPRSAWGAGSAAGKKTRMRESWAAPPGMTADAHRPVMISGIAAPLAPDKPVITARARLPVLKLPTLMVTLVLLELSTADSTVSTLTFLPCFWVTW